jgi:hypothetical protein
MFRKLVDKLRQLWPVSSRPPIRPGEQPLLVFVSSVMCPELEWAREETEHTIGHAPFLVPWVFEFTPASSEPVDEGYLRKVREADFVIWLVGEEITEPVQKEIREALASDRRLLVVKLPADQRSEATEALLREVGLRAKWVDVAEVGSLRRALELTLGDEIVRAVRSKPGLGRLTRLEELGRASRARCIMRWQAAGVPWAEAVKLADDPFVGAPGPELQARGEQQILLLIGEIGAGKSLIAERMLQGAISEARENADAPVPVYLEAQSAVGQLREDIEDAASSLGNPRIQGAVVIIDKADEAGTSPAAELLNEARVLAGTWPRTMVVITSRPIPYLAEAEEAVQVPQLSETEAYALIGQFAGHPITASTAWGWPESVRDAVRRPLFAVLLGTYLRERDMRSPRSTGELLSSLVERSLGRAKADRISANHLLQQLAVLSTDRGGRLVPAAEIASKAELQPLLDSGLVVERSGALAFPLPILTEWFAAQSLAAGVPVPEDLTSAPQRLEHWRYPLIIATGTFGHEQVSKLLTPLAERYPAFAAEIVNEGLARWGLAEDIPPPPSLECGQRVHAAMQTWTKGIGPLAQLIAPVDEEGVLLRVGARVDGMFLSIAWFRGDEDLADVVKLPRSASHTLPPGCIRRRSAQPGRQPAWAWRWTLDELIYELSELLRRRALPVNEGPLAWEAVWQAALAITGRAPASPGPIPLVEIEERLSRLPISAILVSMYRRGYQLDLLRVEVDSLRKAGETELRGPWPGPDRDFGGGGIWASYTDKQILARAKAVYAGALEGYRLLVDTWFPRLAPGLQTAVTLPARLVGVVVPPKPEKGIKGSPVIDWYLEALPSGRRSTVDLSLGEESMGVEYLRLANDRLRALRPKAAMWISAWGHHGDLDVFRPNSATALAYDWLRNDLKRVHWV